MCGVRVTKGESSCSMVKILVQVAETITCCADSAICSAALSLLYYTLKVWQHNMKLARSSLACKLLGVSNYIVMYIQLHYNLANCTSL